MEDNQFSCWYANCDKSYKDKGGLSNHYKRSHGNIKPGRKLRGEGGFLCNICQKDYSTSESLRKHKCNPILIQPNQQQQQQEIALPVIQDEQILVANENQMDYVSEQWIPDKQNMDFEGERENFQQSPEQEQFEVELDLDLDSDLKSNKIENRFIPHPIKCIQTRHPVNHIRVSKQDMRVIITKQPVENQDLFGPLAQFKEKGYDIVYESLAEEEEQADNAIQTNRILQMDVKQQTDMQMVDESIQSELMLGLDNAVKEELDQLREQFRALQHHCPLCNSDCSHSLHNSKVASLLVKKKLVQKAFLDSLRFGQQQLAQFGLDIGTSAISKAIQTEDPSVTSPQLTPMNIYIDRINSNKNQQEEEKQTVVRTDNLQEKEEVKQYNPDTMCNTCWDGEQQGLVTLSCCNKLIHQRCWDKEQKTQTIGRLTGPVNELKPALRDRKKTPKTCPYCRQPNPNTTPLPSTSATKLINSTYQDILRQFVSKRGSDVVVKKLECNYQLTLADMDRLKEDGWFNDSIINAYASLINYQMKEHSKEHVYALNTYFYDKAASNNPQNMVEFKEIHSRWLKKKGILLKDYQQILIPVNVNAGTNYAHWLLVVADFSLAAFFIINSFLTMDYHMTERELIVPIKEFMQYHINMIAEVPLDFSKWRIECLQDVPQQTNGNDCGLCVCRNMRLLSLEADINSISNYKLNKVSSLLYRQLLAIELVNSEFQQSFATKLNMGLDFVQKLTCNPSLEEFYGDKNLYLKPFIVQKSDFIATISVDQFNEGIKQAAKLKCKLSVCHIQSNTYYEDSLQGYLDKPEGGSCAIDFFLQTKNPFKGQNPSFLGYSFPTYDWAVGFTQKEGKVIVSIDNQDIYYIAPMHYDAPAAGQWMFLFEGKKRFYLIPPEHKKNVEQWLSIVDWNKDVNAVFISEKIIKEAQTKFGLVIAEFVAGDLFYMPSHWIHEVHNLSPNTKALTNAVLNPFYMTHTDVTDWSILTVIRNNLLKTMGLINDSIIAFASVDLQTKAQAELKSFSPLIKLFIKSCKEHKYKLTTKEVQQLSILQEEVIASSFQVNATFNIKEEIYRKALKQVVIANEEKDLLIKQQENAIIELAGKLQVTPASIEIGKRSWKEYRRIKFNQIIGKMNDVYNSTKSQADKQKETFYTLVDVEIPLESEPLELSNPNSNELRDFLIENASPNSSIFSLNTLYNEEMESVTSSCTSIKTQKMRDLKYSAKINQLEQQMKGLQLNQIAQQEQLNTQSKQIEEIKQQQQVPSSSIERRNVNKRLKTDHPIIKNIFQKESTSFGMVPTATLHFCKDAGQERKQAEYRAMQDMIGKGYDVQYEFSQGGQSQGLNQVQNEVISTKSQVEQKEDVNMSDSISDSNTRDDAKFDSMESLLMNWAKKGKDRVMCKQCGKEKYWKKSHGKFAVIKGLHQCN